MINVGLKRIWFTGAHSLVPSDPISKSKNWRDRLLSKHNSPKNQKNFLSNYFIKLLLRKILEYEDFNRIRTYTRTCICNRTHISPSFPFLHTYIYYFLQQY
jgi:hypothetical protein